MADRALRDAWVRRVLGVELRAPAGAGRTMRKSLFENALRWPFRRGPLCFRCSRTQTYAPLRFSKTTPTGAPTRASDSA
jgi:hypothetical protein